MTTEENLNEEEALVEKFNLGDFIIAGLLAAVAAGMHFIWSFPGLAPTVWSDATVACGVRPAQHITANFWTILASFVHSTLGISGLERVFNGAGPIALALIAALTYALLRETLSLSMRARPQLSRRRTLVMRVSAILGSLLFCVSDPIGSVAQTVSETTLLLLLTLGALQLYLVFLRKGIMWCAYVCVAALGFLSVETPLGIPLTFALMLLQGFLEAVAPSPEAFNATNSEASRWRMTFVYLVALAVGLALNGFFFVRFHGLSAIGAKGDALPLVYLFCFWEQLVDAASAPAWLLWTGICLTPFLVIAFRFAEAADEEQFLPYTTGLAALICGLIAYSQIAPFPMLWFWKYFPVHSQYLHALGMLFAAMTVAGSIMILGVDVICRNHARLAKQIYGEEELDENGNLVEAVPEELHLQQVNSNSVWRRMWFVLIPLVLLVLMVPGPSRRAAARMFAIVNRIVAETVRECGNATCLFTDGVLDEALELESARQGGHLACIPLNIDKTPKAVSLRTRGITDLEELFAFRTDAVTGLRMWLRDRPARLKNAAAQLGFEIWKEDGKKAPAMGGLLSRLGGFPDEEFRRASVARAHELSEELLKIYDEEGIDACADDRIRRAFLTLQWRLAQMALARGETEDRVGNVDAAIAETGWAERLNAKNPLHALFVEEQRRREVIYRHRMTPREGVRIALDRADYALGLRFAEVVLASDPSNVDANLLMGLHYLKNRQLTRGEAYLRKCLNAGVDKVVLGTKTPTTLDLKELIGKAQAAQKKTSADK